MDQAVYPAGDSDDRRAGVEPWESREGKALKADKLGKLRENAGFSAFIVCGQDHKLLAEFLGMNNYTQVCRAFQICTPIR
jgi:hypothetical protein